MAATRQSGSLKIYNIDNRSEASELEVLKEEILLDRLGRADPVHEGRKYLRLRQDCLKFLLFTTQGTTSRLICIVR